MTHRLTTLLYSREVEPDVVGLYNNIHGHNIVFAPKELFATLKVGPIPTDDPALSELIAKHFIVSDDFSEDSYIASLRLRLRDDIHLMYLLLTQSCNLSCTYCFEGLGPDMKRLMPWSVADRAIDFFFKVAKPERTIIFYGGEPLMNQDVFLKSVEKIRAIDQARGETTKVTMVCNGTLLTPALATFIARHNVATSVSIDGPKELHDLARINRAQSGSYDEAVRGFAYLKACGANASISCTIGDHNIDALEDVARFFASELKPSGVGFNFLMGCNNNRTSMVDATKQLLKAYTILRDHGIYEGRIMRRLKPMANGEFHFKDCAAYGNQFAVRYDGQVGPCHAFCNMGDYFSGDIQSEEFSLDKKSFGRWAGRSQLSNPICISCPASLICGGGCAFNAQVTHGGLDEIDKNICTHSFMLLDWIMEETWQMKKNRVAVSVPSSDAVLQSGAASLETLD